MRFHYGPSPEVIVNDYAQYIWDWYIDLDQSIGRIFDGFVNPIPPSEIKAWIELNSHIVYPREYAILRAMDRAFCEALNKEFANRRIREEEQRKEKNG